MKEKRLGENLYVKYDADMVHKVITLYGIEDKKTIVKFDNPYNMTYKEKSSWYTSSGIVDEIEYSGNCFFNLLKDICEGMLLAFKMGDIQPNEDILVEAKDVVDMPLSKQDLFEDFKRDDIRYMFDEEELEYIANYLQYRYSIRKL